MKTRFEQNLAKGERLLKSLSEQFAQMRRLVDRGDIPGAYPLAGKAENDAEKLVLLNRDMVVCTGLHGTSQRLEENMAEQISVRMGYTEQGWFCLKMPLLLPKKDRGSAAYIRGFLYPAFRRYFANKKQWRTFDGCALIIRHIYDKDTAERQCRDHDNIELNMVVDTVALYIMVDDGGLRCSHHYFSAAGILEQTEVYVVPEAELLQFMIMLPTLPEDGLPFAPEVA